MRHEFPSGDEGLAQNRPKSGPHTGLPAAVHSAVSYPQSPAPPNAAPGGGAVLMSASCSLSISGCVSGHPLDSQSLTPPFSILRTPSSLQLECRAPLSCLRFWGLQ